MKGGINRERQVRRVLDDLGYWTARAAGSHGDADIVALKALEGRCAALLVEVKTDTRGPFANFGPDARAELISAAVKSGATPWLCWWPARKQPKWISVEAWPP